jgi:hypothetical protein
MAMTASANGPVLRWKTWARLSWLIWAGGQAVAALADALARERPLPVRQQSAWALGQIGAVARSALAALKVCSDDPDPRLRRLAHAAIDRVGERRIDSGS